MIQNQQPTEELDAPSFCGLDDQGQRVRCDILVTFDVEDGDEDVHVVVYTDYTVTPDGKTKFYAAQYPNGVNLQNMTEPPLEPLRDALWGAVQEVLDRAFRQNSGE